MLVVVFIGVFVGAGKASDAVLLYGLSPILLDALTLKSYSIPAVNPETEKFKLVFIPSLITSQSTSEECLNSRI